MSDQVSVLFVGGLGRSGTTLLEQILGQLPGACPLGEVVHLWQRDLRDNERCGCGAAFRRCEFWRQVGEVGFGGWHRVDVSRAMRLRTAVERTRHIPTLAGNRLTPRRFDLVREYASYYRRVYQAAAQVTGANVVIDSSKHPALAHCLRWDPTIDLRVAHMVRDSRGVAHSWTKTVDRPEADGAKMTRYHPARSAMLWTAHNMALNKLRGCGTPVRRIRYEDLVTDPVAAVKELAEFADLAVGDLEFLDVLDSCHAAHVTITPQHSAAGNPMRFRTGRTRLLADDAWRTELPERHRWLVGAITSPLLQAYGYFD